MTLNPAIPTPTKDGIVSRETLAAMPAGLNDRPRVTTHDYEELGNTFAAQTGQRRDAAGVTALADSRTAIFVTGHCG